MLAETTPVASTTPEQLLEQLLARSDIADQQAFIRKNCCQFASEEVAELLKGASDQLLRSDIKRSLQLAEVLTYAGEQTSNRAIRALGLLAEANVYSIGLRDFPRAMGLAETSAAIYQQLDRPHDQARVEIALIYPLTSLGRYADAIAVGERILPVLRAHTSWRLLVITTMNMAIVYNRQGDDTRALLMLDEASQLCEHLPAGRAAQQGLIGINRAVALRNLGRFAEAMAASNLAQQLFTQLGYTAEAARSQQSLAMTYYMLGRYNEALEQLDQAQAVFAADGRQRDAMLVELFISDCLLQLRRFHDVLEKCQQARLLFAELGERSVIAQTFVKEAVAYANLGRHTEALTTLEAAQALFQELGNSSWVALTQLEMVAALQRQGKYAESLLLVQRVIDLLQQQSLQADEAQAYLLAARAALALEQPTQARTWVDKATAISTATNLLAVTYQAQQLLGSLTEADGDLPQALEHYDAAIATVERLRGRLMMEFRADYLEDKQSVYEDAVRLCLQTAQPARALDYAERAKSRALLDLLTYRLDLGIQARRSEDTPLVAEISCLRAKRDQLYRRWESTEEMKVRGLTLADPEQMQAQQEILQLEKRITELWHKLLIHNADYAREATLWQVRTEPVQPYLPEGTILLEYFAVRGELLVFLVTATSVEAHWLGCRLAQVQQGLQLLQINLHTVTRNIGKRLDQLTVNANSCLQRLHNLLIAPIADRLSPGSPLIIVPHGPLHYLPYHALYDGQHYLLERHEISYVPRASVLRFCHEAHTPGQTNLIYGHSLQGKLPYTLQEARVIADLWQDRAWVEDELDPAQFRQALATCRLAHLATHGEFRADNPLFSGLVVGDSWLTTLDIFNLRLSASLITLSACQTGRNVIQGGDELAGLMKAFLSAGAASLVLTLWPVEDQSTSQLMEAFYRKLAAGFSKRAALRAAQLQLLQTPDDPVVDRRHPYFWAPFFLVGDPGYLD